MIQQTSIVFGYLANRRQFVQEMLHSTRAYFFGQSQPDLAKSLGEQADQIVEAIEILSISRPLIEGLDTDTEEEEEEEALEENQQTHQKQIEQRYDTPRDSTVDISPKTPEPLPISPPIRPIPKSLSSTPLPNIHDQKAIAIEPLTALNHRQNTASRADEISSDFS
jgi:hypothetical protein